MAAEFTKAMGVCIDASKRLIEPSCKNDAENASELYRWIPVRNTRDLRRLARLRKAI